MILDTGSAEDVNIRYALEPRITPLHCAAERSDLKAICSLVSNGASVNARDQYGATPLHHAAQKDQEDAVVELVRLRANQHLKGGSLGPADTPLVYAIRCRAHRAAKALVKAQAHGSRRTRTERDTAALHATAQYSSPELIRLMLARGARTHETYGDQNWSVLHTAIHNGSVDALECLLEMRADVGARCTASLATPLHFASIRDNRDIIDLLAQAGADIEARDALGRTALVRFVSPSALHEVPATALLHHGADEKAVYNEGKTRRERLQTRPELLSIYGWDLSSYLQARARISALLARAPADRPWRRRGWLVMLRARVLALRGATDAQSNGRENTSTGEAEGCKASEGTAISTDRKRSRSAGGSTDVDSILGKSKPERTGCREHDGGNAADAFREFGAYAATLDQAWDGTLRSIVSYM